jgi:uncharacterized protein (UPF0332 family)
MMNDDENKPLPDIPADVVGPERTLLQMFKLYVEPEVKRRQFRQPIAQAQVLFFEGKSPEVRLNDEVKISLLVRAPRAIERGEAIAFSEIQQHIEAIELEAEDADAGHFTAVTVNGQWLMTFDFRPNKLSAAKLVNKAEEFCDTAGHALSQQRLGPAIDNLFSAYELAAKARLMTSAMIKSDAKKHGTIHSGINLWGKLGNVDGEFVKVFNKLSKRREDARYTTGKDLSGLVDTDMISKARAEIAQLKTMLKRLGDDEHPSPRGSRLSQSLAP